MAVIIVKLGENIIQTHELGRDPVRIGRARDNEIVVENLSVSRHHCRVEFIDNQYVLIDNGSANGIFVNGNKINRSELADNDIISIGKHRLHFNVASPTAGYDSPTVEAPDDARIPVKIGPDGTVLIGAFEVKRGNNIGQIFPINTVKTTMGRSHQNHIRLNDWLVSRVHSAVQYKDGNYTLRDQGSWRGTTINAETIKEKTLQVGDEVLVGNTLLVFKHISQEAAQESTHYGEQLRANTQTIEMNFLPLSITVALGDEQTNAVPAAVKKAPAPPANVIELEDEIDEFAPLSNEELESIEDDADLTFGGEEDSVAASFKKMEMHSANGLLELEDDELRKNEESNFLKPEASELAEDPELSGDEDVHRDDAEEEKALFGGPIVNVEPGSLDTTPSPSSSQQKVVSLTPPPSKPKTTTTQPTATLETLQMGLQPIPTSYTEIPVPQGVDAKLIQRWGHGLQNKSKIIRKEAARKLKELTGIDYDWESGPTE